jgi:hypothetical protein
MTKQELIKMFIDNCNELTAEQRKQYIMNQYQVNTRELIFDNNSLCLRIFKQKRIASIELIKKNFGILTSVVISLPEYDKMELAYQNALTLQ